MLALIDVPGYGQAVAGLDWLSLTGLESQRTEIVQLGRGVDAAWEYVWTSKGNHDREDKTAVALLSKHESRKKPVAAASLVQAAIAEDKCLVLIGISQEVEEPLFWLLAIENGMPVTRMDVVGSAIEILGPLKDYLNSMDGHQELPVYSDQAQLLESVRYSLNIRQFSLGILAHSIKKKDVSRATFSRHTSLPVVPILCCLGLVIGGSVYWVIQLQAEESARRDAAILRAKAIEQRKQELANSVSSALNSTTPASIAVSAYLNTTFELQRMMEGWKLGNVECVRDTCTLTWTAQAFATWAGYLKAKPKHWPAPVFDSDIQKVTQPLPVVLPTYARREATGLPVRDQVRQGIGNLAQISKTLGLTLSVPPSWQRVAGNPALNSPEEQWVPMAGDFAASGPALLLENLARRLPDTCDVVSVTFKMGTPDTPVTFDLKGKAYANP
ncbi:type 4b pilus protein PilO2 [Pseudomonas cichorii]|nr:type 4b pilus protein PilO2 [Pseudomonas cichorii]MBX8493160.1 type 4b pilus protein PilO2 [Pseudomonas cichorii]